MFADFHSLYQLLQENGYYHTAITFEREHRLFGNLFSQPKEETNEQKHSEEWSFLSNESVSLCTPCRSNVKSKKCSASSSLEDRLKHESKSGVTHRICKRCSHHTNIFDPCGDFGQPKRSHILDKEMKGSKAGRCRSFCKGKNFKSRSFPAEKTLEEAGKRLLERANRWPCRDNPSSTLQTASEQNATCALSVQRGEKEMASLFECPSDAESDSSRHWNKTDSFHSLHPSSCSAGTCLETQHDQKESPRVCDHLQSIPLLNDSPLEDCFMTFPSYHESVSSSFRQSTDEIQANTFVNTFSNIFDDLFSLEPTEKE
ncbi:hypothetical protein GpartN1_g5601.t1 [Galdieria partita]|uniref:Uncharacterized protein n=1 Tax=Galdieria partita TaxID=83374 RepID=A0A9C7USU7_9RHOD|nr:hypothetical protein GpartN1_g5601.t1 [Galdieria partita]